MIARIVVVVAIWLLTACGGSSSEPAQPPVPPARVQFADGGALTAQRAQITALVEDTLDRAAAELPTGQVKVTVTSDATRTIPGWGIGGYALATDEIEIVIDPQFPGLDTALAERLPHIVAHELHHTVRLTNPGIYVTLREALIFEAMADHYAIDLLDGTPPPWSTAFPEDATATYLAQAEPQLDRPFNFEAWFFGVGTNLPRWTVYTLGYRILRDYFDANPGENALTGVSSPAQMYFPPDTI